MQDFRPMSSHRPRPWSEFEPSVARGVVGVFTDIDDTLTANGAIVREARDALARLHAAAIPVIAITGRPMGWSKPFVRPLADGGWPLEAIVAENGAVALIRDGDAVRIEYAQDEPTRRRNAQRLADVAQRVVREVPGATLARDSAGRVTDIAIDHSEFTRLPAPQIEQALALLRAEGMNATVSSIHINAWFGEHTKLSGARWMTQRLFGRPLDAEIDRWVYVGDSTNDQPMFERFVLSVGVANLMDFEAALTVWPRYLTHQPRGRGFAEVADALLAARA